MVKLGVNIDHVATLRQARGGREPCPLAAAKIATEYGADGITVHLREDRRHIQDKDVYELKKNIPLPLNLEMACNQDIISVALDVIPYHCTLVPEKRQELTTEGGLDVIGNFDIVAHTVQTLKTKGIIVSLFIEPDEKQILAASQTGTQFIEIHTGVYANSTAEKVTIELNRIKSAVVFAHKLNLQVNAGHGLNYNNTASIALISGMKELNIGHSIISRSVFIGLGEAIKEMKKIIMGNSLC